MKAYKIVLIWFLGVFGLLFSTVWLMITLATAPMLPPPTLYECPCESEELIKDVVRHTNKDGMKSVTTFVDVKGCLIVKE
jgi:hypothetical protein